MADTADAKHTDFHMTVSEVLLAFVIGVLVVGSLWLFSGLLLMLFLM